MDIFGVKCKFENDHSQILNKEHNLFRSFVTNKQSGSIMVMDGYAVQECLNIYIYMD